MVASTDLLVENLHFRREWSSARDIGHRAAAQNFADIAAMGARPTALLVGLGVPAGTEVGWVDELADGLRAECEHVGATVVGGDISGCDHVVLAITALGGLAGGDPVTRAGASPGDVVALAGGLGYSAAGLALLRAGRDQPAEFVSAYRRPRPPYRQGPEALRLGASALIDVSDGLVADLAHIAESSGVALSIETARLPADRRLAEAAAAAAPAGGAGDTVRGWILAGGEDHALVATFPPSVRLPSPWRVIGRVAEGAGVFVDGGEVRDGGWDHFG